MRSRFIVALVLMAQIAVAFQADAQSLVDPRGRDRNRDQSDQAGGMSLDEAVRMVESRYNARAVRAETVDSGGRRVHEIRLLKDGRVWKVRVDAETGQAS